MKLYELPLEIRNYVDKLNYYSLGKDGDFLQPCRLNHSDDRYYWCVLKKQLILINGAAQMFLFPWKPNEKGQLYVYSHHFFVKGAVILVPEEEIVHIGFN